MKTDSFSSDLGSVEDAPPQAPEPSAREAHTPGPWKIYYDGSIASEAGPVVCSMPWDSFKEFNDSPRLKADARLIAAAPELLALLVEAQTYIGGDWRERRDAAIRKATRST